MTTRVLVQEQAVDRLAGLGLGLELIERVLCRADAEAGMCTPLDPPIMEGLTRWARVNRYLREELVPLGWRYDNPRNLPRTIHPAGEFAIVATTGDELTGIADLLPATKYAKGYATARAVEVNEQLTLDFGDFDLGPVPPTSAGGDLLTWLMLFHTDEEEFRVELSLPNAIIDGRITGWLERIILPGLPRQDSHAPVAVSLGEAGHAEPVTVPVARR